MILLIMPKDKEWSAVAVLLNEINKLRERVERLENNSTYYWRYNLTSDYSTAITTETNDGETITLVDNRPRTAMEAAMNYTTYAVWYDNTIDYSNIRNMPNSITNISSQPDALLVDYADWQRSFIPLCITRSNGWLYTWHN